MRFPIPIQSLCQISGMEPMMDIAEKFGVEIIAHGSLVRRLAAFALQNTRSFEPTTAPTLFDLTGFLSDIDLIHSGGPEQSGAIRRAISESVQYSEQFRWEIKSAEERKQFTADEVHLPVIPANRLTLSTREGDGLKDPFDAFRDLTEQRFRLLANPNYGRSQLRRDHRDCGLLHSLFFLQLLCEHSVGSPENQPGWATCLEMIASSRTQETQVSLSESAYLRSRLRYRLLALKCACQSHAQWVGLIGKAGLPEALQALRQKVPILPRDSIWNLEPPSEETTVCSNRIGGDTYRISEIESDVIRSAASQEWQDLHEKYFPLSQLSDHALPKLGAGQSIIAVSPRFILAEGLSPSSEQNEFLCVELPLSKASYRLREDHSESLGVLGLLGSRVAPPAKGVACAFSLTSCCFVRQFDDLQFIQVRVNFGLLLEKFPMLLRMTPHPHDYSFVQLFIAETYV